MSHRGKGMGAPVVQPKLARLCEYSTLAPCQPADKISIMPLELREAGFGAAIDGIDDVVTLEGIVLDPFVWVVVKEIACSIRPQWINVRAERGE